MKISPQSLEFIQLLILNHQQFPPPPPPPPTKLLYRKHVDGWDSASVLIPKIEEKSSWNSV